MEQMASLASLAGCRKVGLPYHVDVNPTKSSLKIGITP
jgi:hypothetical protein